MAYTQLKGFNQSIAGTVKGMCLRNVRLGYGIASKYDNAWETWLNSPQYTSDIPAGVDVPVYFWYIDVDNGHIGVRLANGKFWSDGKTYMSLSSYRLFHPKVHYRGWSDEVNDVKVIQYVAPPPVTPNKMPPVGSRIQLLPVDTRTVFKTGTQTSAGQIRVTDNSFIYIVRGYDPKYPNRILINSKSVTGGSGSLALYFTNGVKIPKWQQI